MTQMEKIKQETRQETIQKTRQTRDQDTSYHTLDIYDYMEDYDVSDVETHTTPTRGPVSCVLFIGLLYFLVMITMIVNDAYQRILREDEQAGSSAT